MTTATTTTQTTGTNWQDVPMRDRYSVGDFVAVYGGRKGEATRIVQIAKVTKTRYMAKYTWWTNGTMHLSDLPTEQFKRVDGRSFSRHSRDYLDGVAYSEKGAHGWLQARAEEMARRANDEFQRDCAEFTRYYATGASIFGTDGMHGVTNVAPEGLPELFQAHLHVAIRGVPTDVMLTWHRRVDASQWRDNFTWVLDFTAFTLDAEQQRWTGPATWNTYEMSTDAIFAAAERAGTDSRTFLYVALLGQALVRLCC